MAFGKIGVIAFVCAALSGGACAAPPPKLPYNPNKTYICLLSSGSCTLRDPKWQFITSVDLDYHFSFKFYAYVQSDKPAPTKQCLYSYSQHVDMIGKNDLGFYAFTASVPVDVAPNGSNPSALSQVMLSGSVKAHMIDPKITGRLAGIGTVALQNILDVASAHTQDGETCIPAGGMQGTLTGTAAVHYSEAVKRLYDPAHPPTIPKDPKVPKPKLP